MEQIEKKIINFLHFSEGLKNELRNGRTSAEKKESVADHTWRVSLMVLMFTPFLDQPISLEKALKIAIIHDIAEIITGDKPYFLYEGQNASKKEKFEEELDAMKQLQKILPEPFKDEFLDLWIEYEKSESYEAKFVKAIDKIEAQLQHNEMNYSFWNDFDRKFAPTRLDKYCEFDTFLKKIKDLVQQESMEKIEKGILN